MVTGQALPVDQRGNDLLVDLECITAALALRVNFADQFAQWSSTGKVFSMGSGGDVVTTRATPISR